MKPLRSFYRFLLGVLLLLAPAMAHPASATVGPLRPDALFTIDSYDARGNTTNSAGNTYRYDPLNRLTNAIIGGTNIVIVYDGDGNRVRKTVNGAVTLYLVDKRNPTGYAQVVEEKTVSGGVTNLARVYALGLDLFAQRTIGGSSHYFGYDGHGSTRFLTDTSASVTDTYRYDAYGSLIASTGSTVNHYRYTGEQWDADLGMYYLRARYLNPNTGRFWTMDSYEGSTQDPLSLHKYLYAHGNPVNGWDPSGHEYNLTSQLSAVANGFNISTRVGGAVWQGYEKVQWLKDGVQIAYKTLGTGSADPVAMGIWMSEFIPFGKALKNAGHFIGKAGDFPGLGKHLTQVMGSIKGMANSGKEQIGHLAANAVARAKGMQITSFKPRGNGGFDDVLKDQDGYFVIVEAKAGINPRLNPAAGSNPAQMSKEWIEKNIDDMANQNEAFANELKAAFRASPPRVRGMVVKTKLDADGNALDPEWEIKEWDEIGTRNW